MGTSEQQHLEFSEQLSGVNPFTVDSGEHTQVIGHAQQVLLPTEISCRLSLNTLYKLGIHCHFVTIKYNF